MRTTHILSVEEIAGRLNPLSAHKDLRLILLFGSAASGRIHKKSDLDIAFLFDGPVDILDLTNAVVGLLRTDAVDVIDLRRASPLLKFSAVRDGVLLYEREPGMFNEFYSLAFRMYADTKKLRDAQTVAIRNFLHKRELA